MWQKPVMIRTAAHQNLPPKSSRLTLQFAGQGLRVDCVVVLAAVAKHSGALEYAAQELRADHEVVLAAGAKNGCALQRPPGSGLAAGSSSRLWLLMSSRSILSFLSSRHWRKGNIPSSRHARASQTF